MIFRLRKIKFKPILLWYSKSMKHKNWTTFHQNGLLIPLVSYRTKNLIPFINTRSFSSKYWPQRIGYALIIAFCFEKKNDESGEHRDGCEEHIKNEEKDKSEVKLCDSENCKEEKYDANTSDQETHDRLFMEAARLGNINDIKRLLKEGVDVNQRHSFGWTALHVAAMNGHPKVIEELLSNGADPNLGDNFSTVTEVAWEKKIKDEEVLAVRRQEFYFQMSEKRNYKNYTALHYAISSDDLGIAALLLTHGSDPMLITEDGQYVFSLAVSEKMRTLLKNYVKEFNEIILKLQCSIQRLARKGYSINVTCTEEPENGKKGCYIEFDIEVK